MSEAATGWQWTAGGWRWTSERIRLALDPARGLVGVHVDSSPALSQLLGVEIVDAEGLGPKPLTEADALPLMYARENVLTVQYPPTPERPVECHARWRIQPHGIFDLEVSALTPGQWKGLSVQVCTVFAAAPIAILPPMPPPLLLNQPEGQDYSWALMCHPQDGAGLKIDDGRIVRHRLFGHDLEKGVILRGRVRALIVPREGDAAAARRAFEEFTKAPPNLSI